MFFYCPQWDFASCMCDKADMFRKKHKMTLNLEPPQTKSHP